MRQFIATITIVIFTMTGFAQDFEQKQFSGDDFKETRVRVGADFALQYQALSHSADSSLIPLGSGINLPTANLNLDGDIAPGIKLNLVTYLSSRHHVEAWVKGGYLLMDELQFLNSDIIDKAMDRLTFKVGVMEINYGDAHFRRSDNGRVINNPFVGNYIMDAFTTAPAFEAMYRQQGWLLMGAVTSGSLKPSLVEYSGYTNSYTPYDMHKELAYYFKGGFDKDLNNDFRVRTTVSAYLNKQHHFGSLYNGDRTGSRYYLVMKRKTGSADDVDPASGHTSGRWGPGFTDENQAYMANFFAKYEGVEVFGTYETTSGTSAFGPDEYQFEQLAFEGLYRFGKNDDLYAGGRYNVVNNDGQQSAERFQIGGGWFMTPDVMLKLEYVEQKYEKVADYGENAGFDGLMFEAAISL